MDEKTQEEDLATASPMVTPDKTRLSNVAKVSYRDYIPLWRYLLGMSTNRGKDWGVEGGTSNARAQILACELVISSSLAILRRLDFSYTEVNRSLENGVDADSTIIVTTPQDVLLLSNMANFLEYVKIT